MKSAMLLAAAAAVGFNVLADDPSYPQLPTERGYGLVDAFISGGNPDDDVGVFRSDSPYRQNGSLEHRLNKDINGHHVYANKPAGFTYGFVPDEVWCTECYGNAIKVTVGGFTPGATYLFQHYIAETWRPGVDEGRKYYVVVNGNRLADAPTVPSRYPLVPCVTEGEVTATGEGKIVLSFEGVSDNATYGGFAIWGKSAPTMNATIIGDGADVKMSWTGADALRYYVYSSSSETGPWSPLATLKPDVRAYVLAGEYRPTVETYYRLVASNGVSTVEKVVKLGDASDVVYTDIATKGETVVSDAEANYRVNAAGEGDLNKLGAAETSANMYVNALETPHALAIGADETLKVGTAGVLAGAGDMTLGETAGQGSVSPLNKTLTLNVEDEDATLTLAAAAKKTSDGDSIIKFGAGKAVLAGGTDIAKISIGAGSVEMPFAADGSFDKELAGTGTFVKNGAGAVTLTKESPTFKGTFEVREGTVKPGKAQASDYFGTGPATIKVDSGATLDVGCDGAGDNTVKFGTTAVVIAGEGQGGKGAVVNSMGRSQYYALSRVALSDDATVTATGSGRFDIRDVVSGTYLKLNGHALTKGGNGEFILTSVPVEAGADGAKIRAEGGSLGVETYTTFGGNGRIELANDSTLSFYNLNSPVAWPLFVESTGGRLQYRAGNLGNNQVAGPISVAEGGTLKLLANDNVSASLSAQITGDGKLKRTEGGDSGKVYVTNAENSYTGGTEVDKGTVVFASAAALPGYAEKGKVTVSGSGNLGVTLGPDGWTAGQVSDLVANADAPDGAKGTITVDTAGGNVVSEPGEVTKPIGIGKTGEGTYVARTAYKAGGGIYADQGTLVISNGDSSVMSGLRVINGATVEIADSEIDFGNNNLSVGNSTSQPEGRLVISGNSYFHSYLAPAQKGSPSLYLANADVGRGVLEVRDNAIVSNKVYLCYNQYSQASVLQSGGEIVNWTGHSSDARLANSQWTSGYWEIAGGRSVFTGYSQFSYHQNSFGTMAIKNDGALFATNNLQGSMVMSRGGHGMIYQTGGYFYSHPTFEMLENNDNGGTGGEAVFNLCGGLAEMGGDGIRVSNRDNSRGQVNLNGGVLKAAGLWRNTGGTDRRAYVTFNGGTLQAKKDKTNVFGDPGSDMTGIYVYEKGAAFDTDGHAVTVGQPISAPEGQGVKAIRWTQDNMIGAPQVIIEGDGEGATAAADYDAATRRVTGITVTCPGWGYTTKPTVKLIGGGLKIDNNTQTHEVDPSMVFMGPNVAGPIVKKGEGTLTLAGANGAKGVEVRGGTLNIPASASVEEGPVVLAGGTLTAKSVAATELTVEGDDGTVSVLNAPITLSGVRASARQPGLYVRYIQVQEDSLPKDVFATAEQNHGVDFELSYLHKVMGNGGTVKAISNLGVEETFRNEKLVCVWDGYVWNRSEEVQVWTFGEHFDDRTYLVIDDTVVLNDVDNSPWTRPSFNSVTVTPGPHRFHLVVEQGGGSSGPATNEAWMDGWWHADSSFGIGVDFEGRGEGLAAGEKPVFENFVALGDDGSGDLFTLTPDDLVEADFAPDALVHVNGGTLKLVNSEAGLFGGVTPNDTWKTADCPTENAYPNLDYANTVHSEGDTIDGVGNKNIGYAFEGFIWNHGAEDVTWTFVENFDDNVYLTIDGVVVLDNGNYNGATRGTVTLAPGAHAIRISLHQGTGGSGPWGSGNWVNSADGTFDNAAKDIGIGIDFTGSDSTDAAMYVPLTATAQGGELPLLTTGPTLPGSQTLPADASIAVSGGAKVDLDGGTMALSGALYTAQGAFVNGTLKPSGVWTVDIADLLAGTALTGETLDLTGAKLTITGDFSALDRETTYELARATTLVGNPELVGTELPRGWKVTVKGNRLCLSCVRGFQVLVY